MSWTPPNAQPPDPERRPEWSPTPQPTWSPQQPSSGPRRGMPWWGVVLIAVASFGAGATLVGGTLAVIGFAIEDDPLPVMTVGAGGEIAGPVVGEVGSCFDGEVSFGFSENSLEAIGAAVPCESLHVVEMFASLTAPGDAGSRYLEAELSFFADDACLLAFPGYVGSSYDDSIYEYVPLVPSREAWAQGDRSVRCVLFELNGEPMRVSARGSRQ